MGERWCWSLYQRDEVNEGGAGDGDKLWASRWGCCEDDHLALVTPRCCHVIGNERVATTNTASRAEFFSQQYWELFIVRDVNYNNAFIVIFEVCVVFVLGVVTFFSLLVIVFFSRSFTWSHCCLSSVEKP